MQTDSIFDTLLDLSLFRGVSRERIAEIVGRVRFNFLRYNPADVIIHRGENCNRLKFILSGTIRVVMESKATGFKVAQTLTGPNVIFPEFLFGRITTYPCRVTALSTASVVEIEKSDYLRILSMDNIFQLNYLNYLSLNAQKAVGGALALSSGDVISKIAFYVSTLTQPGSIDIELNSGDIPMEKMLDTDRESLRAACDDMRSKGIVECLTANSIKIGERRELLNIIIPQAQHGN